MAQRDDELIPTRATLLHRLKDWQNQASWQEFFDIYWPLVYGLATKSGLTPNEAQDVVQEVMLETAKHIPDFKYDPAKGSFKGWLLNLTRWRINDQIRKRQFSALHQPIQPDDHDVEAELRPIFGHTLPEVENAWEEDWRKLLLETATTKARRRLDPKQYQIFDFLVNREWPVEKVAKYMGLSTNQVYVAKHRVTEAIKTEFDRLDKEII